ncbi:MAG: hypothetical protein WA484_10415 [Solirubrobacteraceae bacterium]
MPTPPNGLATASKSNCNGSDPKRWRALKIAALLGTSHARSQPEAHESPSTN